MFAIGLESSKNAIFCYTLRNRCFDKENFQCNRLNKCIRNSAQKKDTEIFSTRRKLTQKF
mgnify:CR=1 FL=1